MDLPPFLLDQWLAAHEFRDPPIRFNLASSTGPRWTMRELQALGAAPPLTDLGLSYAPPEGSLELRRAIGDHLQVDPDWVVVTTGAAEALSILFCLASETDAEIALPEPGFPAFAVLAEAWGLRVRGYALPRSTGYRQSAELVLNSVGPNCVLALVNTPHNPTGSVMARDETEQLAEGLAVRGVPLIVDEVYHPLYFGEQQPSAAGIPNVVAVGDMSKAMSLAGLRIGWIVDADPERRKRMVDARSYLTICSSPVSEALAAHALRNRGAILERLRAVATANLAQLREAIESSDLLSWVEPAGGTMAYPWFKHGRNSRAFCQRLADAGVLIAPGDCFGAPEHMRIGFGAQVDGFGEAVAMLADALTEEETEAA